MAGGILTTRPFAPMLLALRQGTPDKDLRPRARGQGRSGRCRTKRPLSAAECGSERYSSLEEAQKGAEQTLAACFAYHIRRIREEHQGGPVQEESVGLDDVA